MSESDNKIPGSHEPVAFGQQLMLARERAGMDIEEAARALNLRIEIVEALEDSNLDALPPITFVHGYVRTYAKLLGLSEEKLLKEFDQEVPHELETELHPRSTLSDEADSQTPVIKLITTVIIVLAVVVLLYAIYSYYIEKSNHIGKSSQVGSDVEIQLPPEAPLVEQHAQITEDDVLVVEQQVPVAVVESPEPAEIVAYEPDVSEPDVSEPDVSEPVVAAVKPEIIAFQSEQSMTGTDTLNMSADGESWVEIVDANEIRLFYGMIDQQQDVGLTGQAPFDIFLGNAPVVSLSVNSTDIDMTRFTRSNNIAHFKISVQDGQIQFH